MSTFRYNKGSKYGNFSVGVVQVRYEGDLEGAMVQFSSPAEAKKAHDNPEAVLNNRFIRVGYLRKEEFSLEVIIRDSFEFKVQSHHYTHNYIHSGFFKCDQIHP